MPVAAATIPVTVVGGYLGAGKTTLVNHLLRNAAGRRIAVAVNEFGDLPIDSDLIEGADGNILTLAGGCICCTFGSDLVAGLIDLAKRAETIDHILIEASGVALPGAVAQSLSLVAGLALDAIIVVADAGNIRDRAADLYMGDTITRQLASADLVVLNKSDLLSEDDLDSLARWLPARAPAARIVHATYGAVAPSVVLGIGTNFAAETILPPHMTAAYASAAFTLDHPVDAEILAAALADPALNLVRAKGFVRDSIRGWTVLQIVGSRAAVTAAASQAEARIVFIAIGRRIDRARIAAIIASSRAGR